MVEEFKDVKLPPRQNTLTFASTSTPLPKGLVVIRNWRESGIAQVFEFMSNEGLKHLGVVVKDKEEGKKLRNRMTSYIHKLRKKYARQLGKDMEYVKQELDRFGIYLRVNSRGTWIVLVESNPQLMVKDGVEGEEVKGELL